MYTLLMRKQRAAGRAFWFAVLLLGGTAAANSGAPDCRSQSAAVAWTGDDDPDEGGQAA
ncbi:hypothetical protein [Methylomonas sp. TEB]|uniref:hypothetical protein n=1 Tax=Methylomonas sp. TEB TaxID=3398229 RepID=UPI0039F5A8FD